MMEVWYNFNRSLVNYCIICFFLLIQGFVSTQCCDDAAHADTSTNISRIGNGKRYPDEGGCQNIVKPEQIKIEYSKRRCFNLTTTKNQEYLVRGTFNRDHQTSTPRPSIRVLIGVTPIALVNSSDEFTVEGIFKATRDYSNFCLFMEEAESHLSLLELRPISSSYMNGDPSSVLKLIDRVDAGNEGVENRDIRDQYDRIWKANSYNNQTANYTSLSTANITIPNANTTLPPIQVLTTALTHPVRLEFVYEDLDPEYYNYSLILYFLELDKSVQAGQRVFDIYINNEKRLQVDVLAGGSNYNETVISFMAKGFLNLTMVKSTSGSQLGPICNAYEIFQVHPWIQETALEEVNAIMGVKDELLDIDQDKRVLISWSGDPCLPIPWQGLFCDSIDNASVITKMDLSYNGLKGPIPRSIARLKHLRELDLRHNDLEGDFTELLTSLPDLDILYFGCNPRLKNKLPARVYRSNLTTDQGICHDRVALHHSKRILIMIIIGGSLLVIIAIGIFSVCIYKRKMINKENFDVKGLPMTKIYSISSMDSIILKSIYVQSFTLQYIETVTEKYKTLIGEGGFGSVYRGTLFDGQEVAVKVRSSTSTQGIREFENELNLLSSIQHENLVPLLGYCSENEQQILVYPYMSNGSLQDRLYGDAAKRKILDWPTRLAIALGAARGLTYLHTFSGRCLIHRDVKSSNILLDHSMCAKVADFGFSKYAPQEGDSGTSLEVRGTAGYLDPEYYSTQHISAKSDVFSFGVVLLEIVTGREPLNVHRARNEWSLVEWAKPRIRNSKVEEVVDPSIKGGYHAEAMWRVMEVALACIETYSTYRPCMADIVRELEDALIIENNASEYMKSIESIYSAGGSNRFTERILIIPPTPIQTEPSPISQPAPPQPR